MRQPKLGYRRSCTWFHTVITVSVHSTVGSTMRFKSCIPGWDRADDRGPFGDGYHHTRRRTEGTAAINPRVSAHADSAVPTEPVTGSAFHRARPRWGNILGAPLSHNHRDLGGGSSCLSERPLVDSVFCPRHPVEPGPGGYRRVGCPHRAWHSGRRLGEWRTLFAFVVTGGGGISISALLQWWGSRSGEWWAVGTVADRNLDPLTGIVGA